MNEITATTLAARIDDARVGVEVSERKFLTEFLVAILGDHGVKPAAIRSVLVREFCWTDKTFRNRKSDVMNLARAAKLNGFEQTPEGVERYLEDENEQLDTPIWSLQNAARKFGAAALKRQTEQDGQDEPTADAESTEITTEQAVHGDRVAAAMAIVSGMTSEELETFGGTFVAHVRKVRSAVTVAA